MHDRINWNELTSAKDRSWSIVMAKARDLDRSIRQAAERIVLDKHHTELKAEMDRLRDEAIRQVQG